MPIYAYRCGACGFQKDVLQKMSDDPLTVCPSCGKDAFAKQVTAAGFQLKGSGWYVTDFRGGASGKPAPSAGGEAASATAASSGSDSAASSASSASASATAPAPAAAPSTPSGSASGGKE